MLYGVLLREALVSIVEKQNKLFEFCQSRLAAGLIVMSPFLCRPVALGYTRLRRAPNVLSNAPNQVESGSLPAGHRGSQDFTIYVRLILIYVNDAGVQKC